MPDWDNPIEGTPISSVADAVQAVAFSVEEPQGLGDPLAIYVSGDEVPKDLKVVAFVYDSEAFGRVIIIERIPESDPDEYQKFHQELVSLNDDPLTQGRADLVTIRGGVQALITTAEDDSRSVAFWMENGIEFVVEGPTLSFDQAVKVSESV